MPNPLLFGGGGTPPSGLPQLFVEMDTAPIRGGGFTLDHPTLSLLDSGNLLDFADPTWDEDITAYVRGFTTDRGASGDVESDEAGNAVITLSNDGRFTPFNSASPYFPNIVPMRRIRIRAEWGSGEFFVYTGYVEDWPYAFPDEMDSIVTVQLVDGFDLLGSEGVAVSGDFPEQQSGERVEAILDAAGWSLALRNIDTGTVTVPAVTLDNVKPLEHLQQIAFAEGGRFFMDGEGKPTFKARTAPTSIKATWADDGTGLKYRHTVAPILSRRYIRNDIRLTRTGGVEQVSSDSVSQQEFGTRTYARQDVQLSSDLEVQGFADWLLAKHSQPVLRIDTIDDLAMRHQQWDKVLGLELGDAANVIESRLDFAQVSVVQRIHHEYDVESWFVNFQVSPGVVENFARLDDAAFRLDDNFILGR